MSDERLGAGHTLTAHAARAVCEQHVSFGISVQPRDLELRVAPLRLGQMFVAIDPDALAGGTVYAERMEALIAVMLADESVRLPGARRRDAREKAMRDGIVIEDALYRQLTALAS